jgi:Ca2+-binding RTX toxin-like protein
MLSFCRTADATNPEMRGYPVTVHTIKNVRNTTLHADTAGDTWIVAKTGEITTPSTGIDATGGAADRTIIVNGSVYGLNYGIEFGNINGAGGGVIKIAESGLVDSDDTAILTYGDGQEIANNGTINGFEGIYSYGKATEIVNNGVIETENTGIGLFGGTAKIINTGTISSESAIYAPQFSGDAGKVVVINSGTLTGVKNAIELVSDANHQVHNSGMIKSSVYLGAGDELLENQANGVIKNGVVTMDDGNDRFENAGKVLVNVYLEEGNDVADIRGGTFGETLFGGTGDDVFIVDGTSDIVLEMTGEGDDTIKSMSSYSLANDRNGEIENLTALGKKNSVLVGNGVDNHLTGNAGNNRLNGDGGDDFLLGGQGADVFVFGYHYQHDEIMDFQNGIDRIDVRTWDGIENFQDIKAVTTEVGDDLLISTGSDEILIHDMTKAELNAADFIF